MNSKLLEILKHLYTTAVQDSDGVRAGRKNYRMRYDEVPEQAEKAIRQAVAEEMLELVGKDEEPYSHHQDCPVCPKGHDYHHDFTRENVLRAVLREKIKEWGQL